MGAGLVLGVDRWEAARRGDFWAGLTVLDAGSPPGVYEPGSLDKLRDEWRWSSWTRAC